MHSNLIKEQFNKAFVRAISAQAGFQCSEPEVDIHSEDLLVHGHGFDGVYENPSISFQLKATSRKIIKNGMIKFSLKRKNYNDLIKVNVINPRYLAVMLLPNERSHWLEHGFMSSVIRRECYWFSLQGMSPLKSAESITINIPLKNKLNANVINSLLSQASRRVE